MNAVVVVLLGLVLTAGAVRPETEINLDGPVSMLPTLEEQAMMREPYRRYFLGEECRKIAETKRSKAESTGWETYEGMKFSKKEVVLFMEPPVVPCDVKATKIEENCYEENCYKVSYYDDNEKLVMEYIYNTLKPDIVEFTKEAEAEVKQFKGWKNCMTGEDVWTPMHVEEP